MNRRFIPLLSVLVLALLPAGAAAAPGDGKAAQPQADSAGPPAATVKIKLGKLSNGRAEIFSEVPVHGTVRPFVAGQKVDVNFFLSGRDLVTKRVRVAKGKGNFGTFKTGVVVRKDGRYAVSATHKPTAVLGGDSTVRKRWRVSFPALRQGDCGDSVVGFKKALRGMGYIANRGRCFGGKTTRGVLAYRKVNGMSRNSHTGGELVRRVYAGRGGFKVSHPGAGDHLEVSLAKQVLVFTKGSKPYAIYPISSGTSATPTVRGKFTFFRTEAGYNDKGMYYSFYFYGGYAIHGYKSVPNYPASHGCVRTFIADQPEIYERISHGQQIFVY